MTSGNARMVIVEARAVISTLHDARPMTTTAMDSSMRLSSPMTFVTSWASTLPVTWERIPRRRRHDTAFGVACCTRPSASSSSAPSRTRGTPWAETCGVES